MIEWCWLLPLGAIKKSCLPWPTLAKAGIRILIEYDIGEIQKSWCAANIALAHELVRDGSAYPQCRPNRRFAE